MTKRAWKNINLLLYIVLPLLAFGILELAVRERPPNPYEHYGYTGAPEEAAGKPVDLVAVGTSRVLAGILEEELAGELKEQTGRDWHVQNLGAPQRKLVYHYLGLRNLYKEHPDLYKGATVLIEAPSLLPEHMYWRDDWIYPGFAQMFLDNMHVQDLAGLMMTHAPLEQRLDVIIRFAMQWSELFSTRLRTRQDFLNWGTDFAEEFLDEAALFDSRQQMINLDINPRGGIRTEFLHRQLIERIYRQWLEDDRETLFRDWQEWDKTVLADIVKLVRANDGQVVFFEMPLSSLNDLLYGAEGREEDRASFLAQAKEWGIPVVETSFASTDEDLPDWIHLSRPKAEEFSKVLAKDIARVME